MRDKDGQMYYKAPEYLTKLPVYVPTFEEIASQMRLNADIIKKEITDHVNAEISRFKREVENAR